MIDENVDVVLSVLRKGFPGQSIQYKYRDNVDAHGFRIEGDGLTHWLYISQEFMEDQDKLIIINLMDIYKIVRSLKEARASKRLLLTDEGVREVGEDYCKG